MMKKDVQILKGDVNVPLFANSLIVYISKSKNFKRELLKQTTKCMDTRLTQNNQQPFHIKRAKGLRMNEATLFAVASNNIKCFGVTLIKICMFKNFKSLKEKLKKLSENGRIYHAYGSG